MVRIVPTPILTCLVRNWCEPNLIPDDVNEAYKQALWHWVKLRQWYSKESGHHCMVHGDTHMGNWFIRKDKSIGTFDFQVFSREHCMRDVTYFLSCSYSEDLAQDEKPLIDFYLSELAKYGVPKASVPSFDEAWLQYRMQLWGTLYAFVFSGGFADLMDHVQTNCGVARIVETIRRVDATGALYDMLDGKI